MNSEKCEYFRADSYDSEVGQGNAVFDPIHSVTRERSCDFPLGHVPAKLSWGGSGGISRETPVPLFKLVTGQLIRHLLLWDNMILLVVPFINLFSECFIILIAIVLSVYSSLFIFSFLHPDFIYL